MRVDHQQNHQKYLKEDSQLKIYFCYYHRINNKSQPNLNIIFVHFNLLKSNYVYFNHAFIRKFKAQLLLLSKYIDLNYVIKNTLLR